MQIQSVEQRIYIGSIGVTIDLVVVDYQYAPVDLETLMGLTGAATIIIQKPDKTTSEVTATITGTAHNIIRYISVEGDFDDPGVYSFHGKIVDDVTTPTKILYTEPVDIQIRNLFDEEEPVVIPPPAP